jgi:hypothetical protein
VRAADAGAVWRSIYMKQDLRVAMCRATQCDQS